jgi:hypothetical protein
MQTRTVAEAGARMRLLQARSEGVDTRSNIALLTFLLSLLCCLPCRGLSDYMCMRVVSNRAFFLWFASTFT